MSEGINLHIKLRKMTQSQLDQMTLDYAKEDLGYAKEGGNINIAQTLKGLVTINYLGNDVYQAYNNMNEQLTGAMGVERMAIWVSKIYDVSEVEVIG